MCGLTVGIFGASSAVIAVLFGAFFENKGKPGTYSEVTSIFTLYLSIVLFVVVCLQYLRILSAPPTSIMSQNMPRVLCLLSHHF